MKRFQKIGDVILWTEGEWSDYHWKGIFRVLQDFDVSELTLEWIDYIGFAEDYEVESGVLNEKEYIQYSIVSKYMYDMLYKKYADSIEFFPYLVREGYLEDIDVQESRTGCYGDFELKIWSE
jgi:hypothetical protein